jgi:hypothetical protein
MQHLTTPEPFPSLLTPPCQLRAASDPGARAYDPGRDVAHLVDPMLAIACGMIDDVPDLRLLRETLGVTDNALMGAVTALVDFVRLDTPAKGDEAQSFKEHLKASKINDVDSKAKLLLTGAMGELFMTAAWQGKRAAAVFDLDGKQRREDHRGVAEAAEALRERLVTPRGLRDRLKLAARMMLWGK